MSESQPTDRNASDVNLDLPSGQLNRTDDGQLVNGRTQVSYCAIQQVLGRAGLMSFVSALPVHNDDFRLLASNDSESDL
jgi:hypothetical protein